ncbi:hypothetical protein GCM10025867_46660 (plasmid) [Frondihabitans sucicola]|uniref:DUF4901 domain-containing protein n=1 Tax=Frondihabitans sucicola TaxID=1268041 RepID=A0ABM8GVM6_9MICO|nr:hypothetical protein [Frondihabitans sucicola]BDZ52425.1 hypothetical protein GCM10025867_46660 [Frondihabitans sucicola]
MPKNRRAKDRARARQEKAAAEGRPDGYQRHTRNPGGVDPLEAFTVKVRYDTDALAGAASVRHLLVDPSIGSRFDDEIDEDQYALRIDSDAGYVFVFWNDSIGDYYSYEIGEPPIWWTPEDHEAMDAWKSKVMGLLCFSDLISASWDDGHSNIESGRGDAFIGYDEYDDITDEDFEELAEEEFEETGERPERDTRPVRTAVIRHPHFDQVAWHSKDVQWMTPSDGAEDVYDGWLMVDDAQVKVLGQIAPDGDWRTTNARETLTLMPDLSDEEAALVTASAQARSIIRSVADDTMRVTAEVLLGLPIAAAKEVKPTLPWRKPWQAEPPTDFKPAPIFTEDYLDESPLAGLVPVPRQSHSLRIDVRIPGTARARRQSDEPPTDRLIAYWDGQDDALEVLDRSTGDHVFSRRNGKPAFQDGLEAIEHRSPWEQEMFDSVSQWMASAGWRLRDGRGLWSTTRKAVKEAVRRGATEVTVPWDSYGVPDATTSLVIDYPALHEVPDWGGRTLRATASTCDECEWEIVAKGPGASNSTIVAHRIDGYFVGPPDADVWELGHAALNHDVALSDEALRAILIVDANEEIVRTAILHARAQYTHAVLNFAPFDLPGDAAKLDEYVEYWGLA